MRHLPTTFLPRAAATTRMVGHLGKALARRVVGRSEANDADLGEALFSELDKLKGLAMKMGQIMSYMDIGLPEATVARLSHLQEGAEALEFEAIKALIEEELGQPLAELFDSVEREPVAAASIGQVHRAVWEGQSVAVKVRYPSVRASLDSDLSQMQGIGRLASMASSVDGVALVRELHERMVEECDYEREARSQQAFAESWRTDGAVHVPEVVAARTSDGVLTTCWADGERLESLRGASPERVWEVSKALVRFNFLSLLRDRRIQADPHPGNFLVRADGGLVALDYGCVKSFEPETVESWRTLARVVLEGRRGEFPDALVATGQVPRLDRFDMDEGWALQRFMFAPYLEPSFRFDRSWWVSGLRFTSPTAKNQRHMNIPPAWLWLMRMQWGLHAVLVRLGAEGDFRQVLLDCLEERP